MGMSTHGVWSATVTADGDGATAAQANERERPALVQAHREGGDWRKGTRVHTDLPPHAFHARTLTGAVIQVSGKIEALVGTAERDGNVIDIHVHPFSRRQGKAHGADSHGASVAARMRACSNPHFPQMLHAPVSQPRSTVTTRRACLGRL